MRYRAILVLTALGLSASAAAQSPAQQPVQVGITDSRGTAIGFSLLPPSEDGWTMKRGGIDVTLRKKGASDDENSEIEAYLIRLDSPEIPMPAYVEQLRKNIGESIAKDGRFRILAFEVTEDRDKPQCARSHILVQDLKPAQTVNREDRRLSEQYVLSCRLLKNKVAGVEVRYFHRSYASNKDDRLGEKADLLFSSVVLTDEKN